MSDDMIGAAEHDGLSNDFLYGIAGGSGDSECGVCYQIQLLAAEKVWKDDFPRLIIQVVNSGFDVMPGQLDIMVGAGGQGYFTAVNGDCDTHYCQGGPCAEGMFEGDFDAFAWLHRAVKLIPGVIEEQPIEDLIYFLSNKDFFNCSPSDKFKCFIHKTLIENDNIKIVFYNFGGIKHFNVKTDLFENDYEVREWDEIKLPFLNNITCFTIDCIMNSVYKDILAYVCILPFVITPHISDDYKSTI
jgi:hypothetical protein